MSRFSRFVAIDWSGAKGKGHPGIAVACCTSGRAAPVLVSPPGRHWSRVAVLDWLRRLEGDVLIGMDFSFAPPHLARGAYLPGDPTPQTAKAFWHYVEGLCDDEDLGAASLLERHHRRHFYFGAADGAKAGFMHLRRCEATYNACGGGKPSTIYDAIGAAQVAKASFAGMRLLDALSASMGVWPFDPVPQAGPVVVEIYTRIAAQAGGVRKGRSKVRDAVGLDAALAALGSERHGALPRYTDHVTDAMITAAWLRKVADDPSLWRPAGLDPVRETEGWTFGVA